jgi:hypothetical protein
MRKPKVVALFVTLTVVVAKKRSARFRAEAIRRAQRRRLAGPGGITVFTATSEAAARDSRLTLKCPRAATLTAKAVT